MSNRIDNEENNLGLYEREQRDKAIVLARKYGKRATLGRIPVRIDRKTVIFKKK